MATVERVAIATQFVSATDGIDCSIFFRPLHFKDCVAIAMCLIVALFFPFLIEVCLLLYCVVYSLCKITQLEKQDNRKCIFATDGILEQNSVRRTFKCVATVTCLIMAVPHWCFCGVQWLFIHVIYIKRLDFWLERKDSWKKQFRPSQWWPILDLAHMNFLGELKHPCRHDAQNDSEVRKITHTFSIKKKNNISTTTYSFFPFLV